MRTIVVLLLLIFIVGCEDDVSEIFPTNESEDSNDLVISQYPSYENRDANEIMLEFTMGHKRVIFNIDANECLYIEKVDCNDTEASRIVWTSLTDFANGLSNFETAYKKIIKE